MIANGKSRAVDIYNWLRDNGIDVYFPGQKQTECFAPYVVIKDAGTYQYNNMSSTQTLYDIMCYVPQNKFSDLEPFVEQVKALMSELKPMLIPLHYETAPFLDDSVSAHMKSVQYRNMRKIIF